MITIPSTSSTSLVSSAPSCLGKSLGTVSGTGKGGVPLWMHNRGCVHDGGGIVMWFSDLFELEANTALRVSPRLGLACNCQDRSASFWMLALPALASLTHELGNGGRKSTENEASASTPDDVLALRPGLSLPVAPDASFSLESGCFLEVERSNNGRTDSKCLSIANCVSCRDKPVLADNPAKSAAAACCPKNRS